MGSSSAFEQIDHIAHAHMGGSAAENPAVSLIALRQIFQSIIQMLMLTAISSRIGPIIILSDLRAPIFRMVGALVLTSIRRAISAPHSLQRLCIPSMQVRIF